jgi:APA family basic amino acid/polyamine antiporter
MDTSGIFTIKWFPLVPMVFILSYWFVTVNIFVTFKENPYAALICLGSYAAGLLIYYGFMYFNKGKASQKNGADN